MKKYSDRSGHSGVKAFESGHDFIIVQFIDGNKYLYNYIRPGKMHVDAMKVYAESGMGLATYINQNVRNNYFSKL